jgi:hypothetical protein
MAAPNPKTVTINTALNTTADAQTNKSGSQTKQEYKNAKADRREYGMEIPASPRTIYNTWKNDSGEYGGKRTRKRRTNKRRTNKRRTNKRRKYRR